MRIVVQVVTAASVSSSTGPKNEISYGAVVYTGFCNSDSLNTVQKAAKWLHRARIFPDSHAKINLNVSQIKASLLIIPNFTLCAEHSQNRPSFHMAASPKHAKELFESFIKHLKQLNIPIKTGYFQEMMVINQTLHGPYTYVVDF